MIRCKILGYLDTKDDEGNDPKLIVCPIEKVDPMWKGVYNLFNASEIVNEFITLMRVKYFFEHYKDLENKKVYIGDFHNKEDALKVYEESIERYKYNHVQKCDDDEKCNHTQKSKITDFFERI